MLVMNAGGWSASRMISSVHGQLWADDIVELADRLDTVDDENLP